jgi:hypothetical protein
VQQEHRKGEGERRARRERGSEQWITRDASAHVVEA